MRFLLAERAYDRVGTSIGDPAPFQLDRALVVVLGLAPAPHAYLRATQIKICFGKFRILDGCAFEVANRLLKLTLIKKSQPHIEAGLPLSEGAECAARAKS